MWKAVACILVVIVVSAVKSGLVLAPTCPNVNGTGVANVVFASGVTGVEPYALTVGANITVDYKFFATANSPVANFVVYAVWTDGNNQVTTQMGNASVGPVLPSLYLGLPCTDPIVIIYLDHLDMIEPAVVSISFLVPNLGNSSATFIGSVDDGHGTVLACQQGKVNISP